MNWAPKIAAWFTVPAGIARDAAAVIDRYAVDRVTTRLDVELSEHGAIPTAPVVLRCTDDVITGGVVYLAEVRALVVRHPNPFPVLDLFPRLSRLPWMGVAA